MAQLEDMEISLWQEAIETPQQVRKQHSIYLPYKLMFYFWWQVGMNWLQVSVLSDLYSQGIKYTSGIQIFIQQ